MPSIAVLQNPQYKHNNNTENLTVMTVLYYSMNLHLTGSQTVYGAGYGIVLLFRAFHFSKYLHFRRFVSYRTLQAIWLSWEYLNLSFENAYESGIFGYFPPLLLSYIFFRILCIFSLGVFKELRNARIIIPEWSRENNLEWGDCGKINIE